MLRNILNANEFFCFSKWRQEIINAGTCIVEIIFILLVRNFFRGFCMQQVVKE